MKRADVIARLEAHREDIRARFGVDALFLFGSAARDEACEASDVDLLVRFSGPATFSGFMGLKFELEGLLGCPVDLVTERALRDRLRPSIERDAIRVA
ncbi:MAG: nucleotidyltransferase family protein [Planctomycetes bacterium]|nr:nucleotidyltransferase family protein [Planctomycetota bacterium]